jgi:hypothetical protein
MTDQLQNSILQQAEDRIESQLTPQVREPYTRIVVAGNQIAQKGGPNGILGSLQHSKNPIYDCAAGAVNLVGLLSRQSRGTMPMKAMVPAATTLMLQALDFADKIGLVKVGNVELSHATTILANLILKHLGISHQMLQTAAGNIQQMTRDPEKMKALQRAAGVVKADGGAPQDAPAAPAEDV